MSSRGLALTVGPPPGDPGAGATRGVPPRPLRLHPPKGPLRERMVCRPVPAFPAMAPAAVGVSPSGTFRRSPVEPPATSFRILELPRIPGAPWSA
jgi:hypothetical protein